MDAHRGVAAVAENGLCFLANLSREAANWVRWTWCWLCSLSSVYLYAYLLACVSYASSGCHGGWLCARCR